MYRGALVMILAILVGAGATADILLDLEQADQLQEEERYEEQMDLLESILTNAANNSERAEIYWRMSRATLGIGDLAKDAGQSSEVLIATYEEGESFATEAIELDSNNHNSYFYKSANIGKAGQVRGILNSLMSAGPMRDLLKETITHDPKYAAAYFVLGQLYAQVPGVISFGNDDYAVSFARKSINLHEAEMARGEADEVEYDYYIQLASHLIERNWNEKKRDREQPNKRRSYNQTADVLEKHFYYEGTVNIPGQTDHEEARATLDSMIALLERLSSRGPSENRHLAKARELRAGL